jgi:hypothetical protein
MTHSITTLKQLAAEVAAEHCELTNLPEEVIKYVAKIVDLRTIATEPTQIHQDHLALHQTITTLTEDDFNAQYVDLLQEATRLLQRADHVLQLITPALEFIASQGNDEDEWNRYYTAVCTQSIQGLSAVRDRCEVFIGDWQEYQPA